MARFQHVQNCEPSSKIHLTYHSKIIIALLNKMYSCDYQFTDLTPEEILDLIKLADEIIVQNRDQIFTELEIMFLNLVNNDNWLYLLCIVF